MIECVLNLSEGRRPGVLADLAAAAGRDLLDLHSDAHHHRSVLTLLEEDAPRAVTRAALRLIDLRRHAGVHPRLGAVDVVPFVALPGTPPAEAEGARDRFVAWVADELRVPAFTYSASGGSGPSLVEVRRNAFRGGRHPDRGPGLPHPTAGAVAVGARPVLVAYNLWLARADLAVARAVARELRGPAVRALGLRVGDAVQVSLNLVDPGAFGPGDAHDAVAARTPVARAELVGLVPDAVLRAVPPDRWEQLDLDPVRTIESRIGARSPR